MASQAFTTCVGRSARRGAAPRPASRRPPPAALGRSGARARTRGRRPPARLLRVGFRAWWANSIPMTGVTTPVRDEGAGPEAIVEAGLPVLDRGNEAAEGEHPGDRRPLPAQRHRVAHHRAHREAAQHRSRWGDAQSPPRVGRAAAPAPRRAACEGLAVGIADALHQVPVVAGRAVEQQRRARGDHPQPLPRIEQIGEPEQVALVGAASVVEDEQALRLSRRGRSRKVSVLATRSS